jgi:site-specific DNA-methyltransferase (adenine-specific)
MPEIKIIHGDCLEIMPTLADKSADMILCDLPYGTTACKWDTIIPFEPLWKQYKRLIKDNGAIVLTASQPFTSALVMSNPDMFKYEIIWAKSKPSNFMLAKKQILKQHENVLIFYQNQPTYNPQKWESKPMNTVYKGGGYKKDSIIGVERENIDKERKNYTDRNPISVIKINDVIGNSKEKADGKHPTQKPVALFEYLIRTYTNEGDTVLDNCAGSGTTAIACLNTNRNAILIEKDESYYKAALDRFNRHKQQLTLEI